MTADQSVRTWKEAIRNLRSASGKSGAAFISHMHLAAWDGDRVLVHVETPMVIQFSRKYLHDELEKQLGLLAGRPVRVEYEVNAAAPGAPAAGGQEPLFEGEAGGRAEAPSETSGLGLNPRFRFDTFIAGNQNQLAYAAAQAVAEAPGTAYNPLYLYGGVGLGKTHLMQAIGHDILRRDPTKKVAYVTSETFMNDFVSGIRSGSTKDAFKRRYRSYDVLLIDDIQFLAGKDGTQEEFFHTFNALHTSNAQVVLTSDRRPVEIADLEDRLVSRFKMGLTASMTLPDAETRRLIVSAKCAEKGLYLPAAMVEQVAERVASNIRELEGVISSLSLQARASGGFVSPEALQGALGDVTEAVPAASALKPAAVLRQLICERFGVEDVELVGPRRTRELVRPRQILMYLYKHELGMTFPAIGRDLGGRDHTTAMHSVDKIEKEIKRSGELREELQRIKESFYSRRP